MVFSIARDTDFVQSTEKIHNRIIWAEMNIKLLKVFGLIMISIRDIHIECSKQFKWNLNFYVSGQSGPFWAVLKLIYALSFYVTKTVLVSPKWFWSDQIDLDLTIMIWSRP